MVDWLCVPLTHLLVARNWNLAISLLPLTASRVANKVAVSTPLRIGLSMTLDIWKCSLMISGLMVCGGLPFGKSEATYEPGLPRSFPPPARPGKIGGRTVAQHAAHVRGADL